MRWLREPSAAAVADALRMAVPDLAGLPVTIPSLAGQDDPVWQMPAAALGEDYIVKFAWSRAAARFVLHQIRILEMLAVERAVPYLPEVVAAGTSPLILVTRRARGTSLFKVVDGIGRDHAARQLARFLAALHSDQGAGNDPVTGKSIALSERTRPMADDEQNTTGMVPAWSRTSSPSSAP